LLPSFIKLQHVNNFTKEIAVGTEQKLFVFTRMENVNGVKFFITTTDETKKPIAFSLTRGKENSWKLMAGSLRWLYAIEDQLADAIRDTQMN
jgi:hypothetical protein